MTPPGTAHGRLTRALASGNVLGAETAVRELGRLSLEDALGLCVLYLACAPARGAAAQPVQLKQLVGRAD